MSKKLENAIIIGGRVYELIDDGEGDECLRCAFTGNCDCINDPICVMVFADANRKRFKERKTMTYVLVFLSLAVAAVAVWAVRVYRLRRWLKAATVEDVVNSRYFRSRMEKEIIALNNQRAEEEVKAQELKGTLKSHPIEHLQDEGVWNAGDMSYLFLHYLQKTLIGYSQADRRFIGDVGRLVYQWTVSDLCRRAFIKHKKGGAS